MFLFIMFAGLFAGETGYLNTSHVFIYPAAESSIQNLETFKYISCFYLSACKNQ